MSEVTSTNALVKDSTMQTLNSKLDTLNTTLGGNTNIAPVFNTATAYTKGDMVYYNNDLYVFTSNHSAGAWTGNDVVQTKVSTELSSLKSGLNSLHKVEIIQITLPSDLTSKTVGADVEIPIAAGHNNHLIIGVYAYVYSQNRGFLGYFSGSTIVNNTIVLLSLNKQISDSTYNSASGYALVVDPS